MGRQSWHHRLQVVVIEMQSPEKLSSELLGGDDELENFSHLAAGHHGAGLHI